MRKRKKETSLGFRFTLKDEWLMDKAKRKSEEFMANYGKGSKSRPLPIDARRYINTEDIEYATFAYRHEGGVSVN